LVLAPPSNSCSGKPFAPAKGWPRKRKKDWAPPSSPPNPVPNSGELYRTRVLAGPFPPPGHLNKNKDARKFFCLMACSLRLGASQPHQSHWGTPSSPIEPRKQRFYIPQKAKKGPHHREFRKKGKLEWSRFPFLVRIRCIFK